MKIAITVHRQDLIICFMTPLVQVGDPELVIQEKVSRSVGLHVSTFTVMSEFSPNTKCLFKFFFCKSNCCCLLSMLLGRHKRTVGILDGYELNGMCFFVSVRLW